MVGWHLLLLLIVEALAYGAIGWHVHVAHGWSACAATALALGIYVAIRVVLVGTQFVIGRIKGSPIPPALHVPATTLIVMVLRELGGWLLMFALVMPWAVSRRSVTRGEPENASIHPPVLLVHGLGCDRANWFWFKRQLRARGFRVYTMDCTPPVARIARYAMQVDAAIDEIRAVTGTDQIVLVGHSQGGLAIRGYLDRCGGARVAQVAKVVTLASPHLGTFFAGLAIGPNLQDMRIGSEWLAGMAERERAGPRPPFTCLFTYHDNLVAPQLNAVLPGSKAIALSGIGHLSLTLSRVVVDHVADEIGLAQGR